ncbi:MAG: oligosaccharide flippase family protein [Clostridium sp.]|nr:oligosaccharide flippase family protein [Clostridium sp.]
MSLNEKSRTENAKRNAMFAVAKKLIMLLLVLISRRFFIKYIGVEYLGINGLFANVLTLLSLVDLGIGTALNVSLYKPIAEKDTRALAAIIGYFKKVYWTIAAVVTVVGLGLIPFLKYIVNMDQDIPHLYLYYVIMVSRNAFSYLFAYKSSIITADQKSSTLDNVEICFNVIKTILQIVAIIVFQKYLAYLILDVIYVVARNLMVTFVANKNYPFIKDKAELQGEEKKRIRSNLFSLALYRISYVALNGTDNILMSILIGTVYVGMYSNYYSIANNIEALIGLVFMALTPSIGNLVATSKAKDIYRVFHQAQITSFWLSGVVCAGLTFLMQDFITLWLGEGMLLDKYTVAAIALYQYYAICMRPIWIFREGTGMYRQIRYIMLITAVLNIVLSIVLGKYIGLSGILFATTIANLLTCFLYEPRILFKSFLNTKPIVYYRDYFINVLLTLFGMVLCYFALRKLTEVSVVMFIVKGVICTLIMSAVYFVRYFRTPDFKELVQRVLSLIRKKQG